MTKSICPVVIFSISFAFVEAAVVVYLRHLLGSTQPDVSNNEILFLVPGITFLEPQTAFKIISDSALLAIERVREAATLIMIVAVAAISGKKLAERIAYFLLAFGIWDIFYYVFLRLTIGWPKTLLDLDIFFLLPTPWVGPVLVPILLSFILISGSLLYFFRTKDR